MAFVPLIVLSVMALGVYAAIFKLAAFVFKRTSLTWTNSFLFALLLIFVILAARGAASLASSYFSVSEFVSPVVALAAGLLLGGWFFGAGAANKDGSKLSWYGGMLLTLLGFAILICPGVLLILAIHFLRSP